MRFLLFSSALLAYNFRFTIPLFAGCNMKELLFFAALGALLGLLIYTNDRDYKNAKRLYYQCSSSKKHLLPLTPYQHKILKDSQSIKNYICIKKQYTRYYVNILKENMK